MAADDAVATSWPSTVTRPASGFSSRPTSANSVDFPAPLGPMSAVTPSPPKAMETSSTTVELP